MPLNHEVRIKTIFNLIIEFARARHVQPRKQPYEVALPRFGPPGKDEILIGHSTDQLKKTLPTLLNGGEKGLDVYGEAEPPG